MLLTALIRLCWTMLHETACFRDENKACCRQNGESMWERGGGGWGETRHNTRKIKEK